MKLSLESIDFARNHIKRYYDTDFFPPLKYYQNIWNVWDDVKNYLSNEDIGNLDYTSPRAMSSEKTKGGYRIVHQLDPINAIVYTALAYSVAQPIENSRIAVDEGIACSYRFCPKPDGNFFIESNGYDVFTEKSREYCSKYSLILLVDIVDFYNQIYLHRLQNAIEACDKGLYDISKDIEKFIMNLNMNTSKGIPVGPAASIIFSEAILNDIDRFILNKGIVFTRYVDDFRIFSDDRHKLELLLQELTNYLYQNHRLSLSSSKTRILSTEVYIVEELESPANIEKQKIHEELGKIHVRVNAASDYDVIEPIEHIDELPSDDQVRIQVDVLRTLMEKMIDRGILDLGLARHILRRSRFLRSRAIYEMLLENFDLFTPVIRDVGLYLESTLNETSFLYYQDKFERILLSKKNLDYKYIRHWMCWLFTKKPYTLSNDIVSDYVEKTGRLWHIEIAKITNNLTSLRDLKNDYENMGLWERYSYLDSLSILPKEERKYFLAPHIRGVRKTEEFIIKALIRS
jgi:hypothetical protein